MQEQPAGFADTALGDIRVLDLTGELGIYCSKLLADLGADVVRIEPPSGHPSRLRPPFYHDQVDKEKSLYHFLVNTSKRGVTLNLEHPDGQQIFRRLIAKADVLVESLPPGYLDDLQLGYQALSKVNPGLILTSITPFGQTGPYRHYNAVDIVGQASGGLMYVTGWPDEPPLLSGAEQGYYMASIQAAVGTLIALSYRDWTGEGQHVDVSMQEAVATTVQPQAMFWPGKGEVPTRFGHGQRTKSDTNSLESVYRCQDGWIAGLNIQGKWDEIVAWLDEEGAAEDLIDAKYRDVDQRNLNAQHIQDVLSRFTLERPMDKLTEGAQRHSLWAFPMNTQENIVNDPHLQQREYFMSVEHLELGDRLVYPGPPFRLSRTPWQISRRAPHLGEHNVEIYHGELGISKPDLALLKAAGVI